MIVVKYKSVQHMIVHKVRLISISTNSTSKCFIFIGTRYKRRGVDEDGNVANYVETEQVHVCVDKVDIVNLC